MAFAIKVFAERSVLFLINMKISPLSGKRETWLLVETNETGRESFIAGPGPGETKDREMFPEIFERLLNRP